MNNDCYYFGCWFPSRLGHYLHTVEGKSLGYFGMKQLPWPDFDCVLCPGGEQGAMLTPRSLQVEGKCSLHHKDGWTALAFWDRSADQRFGSNSVFFLKGLHTFQHMTQQFEARFPHQFKRFGFKLELATAAEETVQPKDTKAVHPIEDERLWEKK